MILAYDYPLLGVFWSMIVIFFGLAWLMALFYVLVDVFRSHDMGGFAKAIWALFIVVLPFLGLFTYVLIRGGKMVERADADAEAQYARLLI